MENLDLIVIGERIRKQRVLLNITREKMAEHLEISPIFVYNIEIGARGMSLNTLAGLSRVLCVTADYILFGEKEKTDINPLLKCFSECSAEKTEYAEELLKLFIKAVN